jgi:hypothetical protein
MPARKQRIAVVIGSTRPTRICAGIAAWACEATGKDSELRYELLDLAETGLPFLDEPLKAGLRAEELAPGRVRAARSGEWRWERRIRRTVAALMWWPNRVSSPCTLRYPTGDCLPLAAGPGRRSSRWSAGGRAGSGQVHLRVSRRRCQVSSVPGVTSRLLRSAAGSRRASAARMARSAQSSLGRGTWRRSTITSWRSTRTSALFDAWRRPRRTSQPDTRTMIRYSTRRDTNRDLAPTPIARTNRSSGTAPEF